MKQLSLLFPILFWFNVSLAQEKISQGDNSLEITLNCSHKEPSPLFVIIGDNYQGTFKNSNLDFIKPDWINSIHVNKGNDAIKKYGKKASEGAIEIIMKNGLFDSIPKEIRRSFQKVNLSSLSTTTPHVF